MHLVGPVTELLTLLEFVCDVRIAGGCDKGWEPVEPRYNSIFNFARRYPAGPADDHRNSETAFECRALASGKRSLSTIGPSKVLGPVVGREGKDRVALKTIVPHVLHDRANNVVELRHSGFLNSPAVLRSAHVLVLLRQVRDDVHPGWIKPEEERLAVLSCLVEELERIRQYLVVNGLHALRTEFASILYFLFSDLAPTWLVGWIIHVRSPAVDHIARTDRRLECRRIVAVAGVFHRI